MAHDSRRDSKLLSISTVARQHHGTLQKFLVVWARTREIAMSLYYEAASVLANSENAGGSLKSRLYRQKDLKSSPAQLFALISEASKWSLVLKDVVEKCGLLREEKKVSRGKNPNCSSTSTPD